MAEAPERQHLQDILVSLEILANERKTHIEQARVRRAEEEERHAAELRSITQSHRNANRALVQAIEAAHDRGVPKGTIYERIGMTTQRFGQLRRQVAEWDREEAAA